MLLVLVLVPTEPFLNGRDVHGFLYETVVRGNFDGANWGQEVPSLWVSFYGKQKFITTDGEGLDVTFFNEVILLPSPA